jgi:hypothetical protein
VKESKFPDPTHFENDTEELAFAVKVWSLRNYDGDVPTRDYLETIDLKWHEEVLAFKQGLDYAIDNPEVNLLRKLEDEEDQL